MPTLSPLQVRRNELDRRAIASLLRTQHHDSVKRCVASYMTSQQVADVMLQEDQERRGVNRPWSK